MKATKNKGAQTNTKKITVKKIVIYVLLLLTSPFWLLYLLYFAYSGFSIELLLPQDKMALSYLQERYGQEFKIIRSTGSSWLGGPISYDKVVAPISKPSLEFTISKCLARCSDTDGTDYTDTYPSAVYEDEITHYAQQNALAFGLSNSDTFSTRVWPVSYTRDDKDIFRQGSKELLSVVDLSPRELNRIGVSVEIKSSNRNPRQEDFDRYAAIAVNIRDSFASKKIVTKFYYTVYAGEKTLSSNGKYELHDVYEYRTPANSKTETNDVATISKLFVKEKRSDLITN
jgi:hypothetical protein